jgi:hypothetical protein
VAEFKRQFDALAVRRMYVNMNEGEDKGGATKTGIM